MCYLDTVYLQRRCCQCPSLKVHGVGGQGLEGWCLPLQERKGVPTKLYDFEQQYNNVILGGWEERGVEGGGAGWTILYSP